MITDGDKMAAATLAASMLQPIESSGNLGEMAKTQARAVQKAAELYREVLAAIEIKNTPAGGGFASAAASASVSTSS
jgi:hypothetical protein